MFRTIAQLTLMFTVASTVDAQESWQGTWRRAREAAAAHRFPEAIELANDARQQGLEDAALHYYVGRWQFQAANAKDSLSSFDAFVKGVPERSNSLWERGISCYYAGEHKAGAKQFEDYQKYHNNDVENAVWRYLCQQRYDGKEKARRAMLPIKNDRRVPMMEIYRLFRGELEPEDVLSALSKSRETGDQKKIQSMHAHLYLGLYYDSEGKADLALDHIKKAVQQFDKGGYMWSVAVVHQKHYAKAGLNRNVNVKEASSRFQPVIVASPGSRLAPLSLPISGFLIVLVLNEMVLVLVIEAPDGSITSTSTALRTEHDARNP